MAGTTGASARANLIGDDRVDGILSTLKWSSSNITYAFPDSQSDYSNYVNPQQNWHVNMQAINSVSQYQASLILDKDIDGSPLGDFLSVEGFTNLNISLGSQGNANLRYGTVAEPHPGFVGQGWYPNENPEAGDIWFDEFAGTLDGVGEMDNPLPGRYAHWVYLHETGHALGLKHPWSQHNFPSPVPVTMPNEHAHTENTVMAYTTATGHHMDTLLIGNAPQTYMIGDIAALQAMYGADYTTNAGDTVYSWRASGAMIVGDNIQVMDAQDTNNIFMTLWDGGGVDTFDLSNYSTNLRIDLRPGESSTFSENQLAATNRAETSFVEGNVYNALLFNGDTRSLIENVIAGSGDNDINGNQGANFITGGGGIDTIRGYEGNDTLKGGSQTDKLWGGIGNDILIGGWNNDTFVFKAGGHGNDIISDFGVGDDIIKLETADYVSTSYVINNATQEGSSVILHGVNGTSIELKSFTIGQLNSGDFEWI